MIFVDKFYYNNNTSVKTHCLRAQVYIEKLKYQGQILSILFKLRKFHPIKGQIVRQTIDRNSLAEWKNKILLFLS